MKNIFVTFTVLIFLIVPFNKVEAAPNLNPKAKAFLLMTAYGTVGGFLLGSASLAFDTPGRSPFIGASLGLYAGIAFGSYVLVSHYVEKDRKLNPQKYLDGPGASDYGELPNQMMNQFRHEGIERGIRPINKLNNRAQKTFFFNIFRSNF